MPSKADLFLELAKPDADGFSRDVSIDEFVGRYSGLQLGNGGSWCRDDGALGKRYNIYRKKEKNRIVKISLHGHNKNPIHKGIATAVYKVFEGSKCVVLGVSEVEVDHKDGRRDDTKPLGQQSSKDFQPLSKAANDAKRNHCKRCRETNKRFDATQLGYAKSQVKGNGTYRGSCVGCFWYDPVAFRNGL